MVTVGVCRVEQLHGAVPRAARRGRRHAVCCGQRPGTTRVMNIASHLTHGSTPSLSNTRQCPLSSIVTYHHQRDHAPIHFFIYITSLHLHITSLPLLITSLHITTPPFHITCPQPASCMPKATSNVPTAHVRLPHTPWWTRRRCRRRRRSLSVSLCRGSPCPSCPPMTQASLRSAVVIMTAYRLFLACEVV